MLVIVTENVPPRLRGRLAVWLVEVRAGVYVGNPFEETTRILFGNKSTTEWKKAMPSWSGVHRRKSGYDFVTVGKNRRMPVDFDGLRLVSFLPQNDPYNMRFTVARDRYWSVEFVRPKFYRIFR